jgi:hypothetical protein
MATRERDDRGRLTGRRLPDQPSSPQAAFNLLESLRSMFQQAERAGDYSGASTIARTIASLGASIASEAFPLPPDWVSLCQWTPEERTELRTHLAAVGELRARVFARHQIAPLPWPEGIDEETTRMNDARCHRCNRG